MRIKFNDKIYRLKEIESGVDSLMELVEEPKYKDGDFVYEDGRIMIVKSYPNMYHANVLDMYSDRPAYDDTYGLDFSEPVFRHATEEEKQILIDAMKRDGKRWNAKKKCIEDIPKRKFKAGDKVALESGCTSGPNLTYLSSFDEYIGKELIVIDYTESGNVKCNNGFIFAEDWLELYVEKKQPKFKAGDKVRIKDGISSETHRYVSPNFIEPMDEFIWKELTVKEYSSSGFVVFFGDYFEYHFNENWLEPWSDEPKVGDMVIAWNNDMSLAVIGIKIDANPAQACKHVLNNNNSYKHAIKFDGTKQHLEKVRKG